jgi:hypothetical protein
MVMTRIAAVVFTAVLAVVAVSGCNKPSDGACRKAIKNMRSLMGTDGPTSTADINGDVRRCKGGSKKKAVECASNATTLDELRACDFMKVPHKSHDAAGSGTAAPPTPPTPDPGSAGSAPPSDSAAAGSADGSGSAH